MDARPLPFSTVAVPGRGVARLPLESFLPDVLRIVRGARVPDADAVAGWGYKPTARQARAEAAARGLPYLALEDGFLRSVGLGEAGTPPLSLVADDIGIYYDARGPSRLEAMLESGEDLSPALLARAERARARIVALGLSKTNAAPPVPSGALPPRQPDRRRILVVDQTAGDASIAGGLCDGETFSRMVALARAEPDAEVLLRRHPAVAAGLKAGALPPDADLGGITLLDQDVRAADILGTVDEVWTATSLLGFEALLHGLPVRCFGLPFYAGWGLTQDEQSCPRRTARRSLDELVAAALILYSRYRDPISGRPTTLEDTIERLAEWRDTADANAGPVAAVGFRPWKRWATRNLVSGPSTRLTFHTSIAAAAARARREGGRLMIWSGKESAAASAELAASDRPVLRMEDGFIRSRGLGSDFHLPASVVLDPDGIYYDRHAPSALERLLETHAFSDGERARAAALRRTLVDAGLSKYNVGAPPRFPDAGGRFRLLVVGQVEDDRSIERGAGAIRTNLGLLEAARAAHPDAWIAYKPHPDVESGNRRGVVPPASAAALADHLATHVDIAGAIGLVDGLATITSLAGFEALMRSRRVWTYGGPFYAGWGLTEDAIDFPRRTRRLALDELVAGALILYPRYVHPPSGLPCRPEELVAWLAADAPVPGARRLRWLRALARSVAATPPVRY